MVFASAVHGFRWAATLIFVLVASGGESRRTASIPVPHPATMLLRAEPVHRELGLSNQQAMAAARIAEEAEFPLWRLRDVSPAERDREVRSILDSLRARVGEVLTVPQMARLEDLEFQALGARVVLESKVANALNLSPGQTERIQTIFDSQRLHRDPSRTQREVRAVLSHAQRDVLASLLGRPFDLSRVPQIACRVPELTGVTAWINSSPVALSQLRGKVMVVHFYAFGCINCIRNLPHYNAWFDHFSRDEVAIVGIHRPETEAERDIHAVRRKAAEVGIRYPVAVDNGSHNWDAWVNRVWPSVYLIDKRGFVRYWWYGELNWQGAQGESWIRSKIAELSAESMQ